MNIDRQTCKEVEVLIDQTGKLWINIDGVCVVRIGKPESIVIDAFTKQPQITVVKRE